MRTFRGLSRRRILVIISATLILRLTFLHRQQVPHDSSDVQSSRLANIQEWYSAHEPDWIQDWFLHRIFPPSLQLFDRKALEPYEMAKGHSGSVQQDPLGPLHPPMFDLLYTWVNGSDPVWQFNKEVYEQKDSNLHGFSREEVYMMTRQRFRESDDLRYSIRSVHQHASSVVKRIKIVSADTPEESVMIAIDKQLRKRLKKPYNFEEFAPNTLDTMEVPDRKSSLDLTHVPDPVVLSPVMIPPRSEKPFFAGKAKNGEVEQGQVPQWLNRSPQAKEEIDVIHHSRIWKDPNHLPVFSSVAIESQIHHADTSDIFIYLNDDIFFGRPLSPSDFYTPLYGLVFRFQVDTLIPPAIRKKLVGETSLNRGYWDNLCYTNHVLSQKFGARSRGILSHIPTVASRSILNEIEAVFPQAFEKTSQARFRTDNEGQMLNTMFLAAHFVVERLRETQLRSFWNFRLDQNVDRALDWEERLALIKLIEDWNENEGRPHRERMEKKYSKIQDRETFLTGHRDHLQTSGYDLSLQQSVRDQKENGERATIRGPSTEYLFSGMDGMPFLMPRANTARPIASQARIDRGGFIAFNNAVPYMDASLLPSERQCRLDLGFCLGPSFLDATISSLDRDESQKILERLTFREFHCGDCLLQIVLQSDRGVEFYRAKSLQESEKGSARSTDKDSKETAKHKHGIAALLPIQSKDPEAFRKVLSDLYRYNYVIGRSDFSFVSLVNEEKTDTELNRLKKQEQSKGPVPFLCFNDDIEHAAWNSVKDKMDRFFSDRFKSPSPWEHG